MVKVQIGDLFDAKAQTLVNTVNCVGVMGKGIALEFKKRFPEMFIDYQARCKRGEVRLGRPYLYHHLLPPWILNFPTKDDWRSVAKLDSIITGLKYLLDHYQEWGITSLAVPPLGAGQGQLEWRIVGPTLYRYLSQMDIPVELYAPYGTPHEELQIEFLDGDVHVDSKTQMPEPEYISSGAIALVEILHRIDSQPYHWPIGRTIFQKIAYIATDEGLPTALEYQRGSYGPFAPLLKKLITRLVNNGLIREDRIGNMFAVRTGPTFADARKAYGSDLARWDKVIDKIVDLFVRLDTHQAETVSTVLFAAREIESSKKERSSEQDVVREVMKWKQHRRPPLEESEVAYTVRNLAALGWLRVDASQDLLLSEDSLLDA